MLLCVPALLLAPVAPALNARWFQLREPLFMLPLGSAGPARIRADAYGSGEFGAPRSGGRTHRGVDLAAPMGTAVLAAKSGTARIGRKKNGMGLYVEVHHPDGSMTLYGHLREILVRDGQRVRRGQVLGSVGKTGNAGHRLIQPHLHFEVWDAHRRMVDPLKRLEGRGENHAS